MSNEVQCPISQCTMHPTGPQAHTPRRLNKIKVTLNMCTSCRLPHLSSLLAVAIHLSSSWECILLLRDTTEGLNKHIDNPAQGAEEVCDTSSGACISARKKSISMDHNNNSTRDGELCDAHTKRTPSHNSN